MIIPLSIIIASIRILALFFAAFIFWRKLKEDLRDEDLFVLMILMSVAGFIGSKLLSLQGAFLGVFLVLLGFCFNKKWNSWQVADGVVFPLLLMVFVFYLSKFLTNYIWADFSVVILALIMIFFSKIMEKKYRSLSWYKSGKVGFLACFSIMAFFSLFLILELFFQKALYLTMIIDLGIVIFALVLLYKRSERDWLEDKGLFLKIFKRNGR